MLFRNIHGELIQINRYDFKTDLQYHTKIMELHKPYKNCDFTKLKKTLNNKKNK